MSPDEVRELLPWYAAGSLDPAETHAVEAELQRSPELRRELDQYRVLGKAVSHASADEPALRADLIQDVLRRVDAYEAARASRARSARGPTLLERVKDALFGGWGQLPAGGRIALAAQCAVILVLVGVVVYQQAGERQFVTLSGSGSSAASAKPAFTVVFQPDASEARIRELLQRSGLEIVGGPSGQQAYAVAFASGTPPDSQETLQRLRSATDVVRFASPLE